MTWDEIPGWFDWQNIYDELAYRCDDSSIFVEVGVWRGRSICYLAQACQALGKRPTIWAVDTWAGSAEEYMQSYIREIGGREALFAEFKTNVAACGLEALVSPLRLPSVQAATHFNDQSLDFVFIDGSHDYDSVRDDIAAWSPKVKEGGAIGGHDALMPSVKQALNEAFENTWRLRGLCWWRAV